MSKTITDRRDFKLGLFSPNCSSGLAVTKVPERWSGSWDDNLRLARLCDDVGIDFLLPIARWIGYGGETNFHQGVLDPVTWAAGLLAHTHRLVVFAALPLYIRLLIILLLSPNSWPPSTRFVRGEPA